MYSDSGHFKSTIEIVTSHHCLTSQETREQTNIIILWPKTPWKFPGIGIAPKQLGGAKKKAKKNGDSCWDSGKIRSGRIVMPWGGGGVIKKGLYNTLNSNHDGQFIFFFSLSLNSQG